MTNEQRSLTSETQAPMGLLRIPSFVIFVMLALLSVQIRAAYEDLRSAAFTRVDAASAFICLRRYLRLSLSDSRPPKRPKCRVLRLRRLRRCAHQPRKRPPGSARQVPLAWSRLGRSLFAWRLIACLCR